MAIRSARVQDVYVSLLPLLLTIEGVFLVCRIQHSTQSSMFDVGIITKCTRGTRCKVLIDTYSLIPG